MPLSAYCANVLKAELAKSDYNGMTADQGWAWLTQPILQSPVSHPSGVLLTPVVAAKLVGAANAEKIAAALKSDFPITADHLMDEGIDPTKAETQGFLAQLVAGNVIAAADRDTLVTAGTVSVPRPDLPPRFDTRFEPALWPHVDANGNPSADPNDQAIHGFPNSIERADFDTAWAAAGRS